MLALEYVNSNIPLRHAKPTALLQIYDASGIWKFMERMQKYCWPYLVESATMLDWRSESSR
jgi:hypothetical protein